MDNRPKQRYISMDTRIRDETTQGYAIWNMKAQVFLRSFLLFYVHKTVGRYLSCNFQSVASSFFLFLIFRLQQLLFRTNLLEIHRKIHTKFTGAPSCRI